LTTVFWQNLLSPHQAPFLRALAGLGHGVTIVAAESMSAERLALGWKVADPGRARVVVAPGEEEVRQLIESSPMEAVHVMAGARWTPLGNLALRECLESGRRVGIMSEAPDPRGLRGVGRLAKYTLERCAKGSHYEFVLAMGEQGVRWFEKCGYPARNVFPFAYVTEPGGQRPADHAEGGPSLLYAGRFIPLKALDLLLRAFAALPSGLGRLRLVGEGPEKGRLQDDATRLRIQNRVTWIPKTESAGVQAEMEAADVTVLPSRKDGWGAVVNESLMAGTPVICSTACGAAELIRQPWLGSVFRSGRVGELTKALRHWIDLGRRSQAERERIRAWSMCIRGQVVAEYFAAIVQHVYFNATRPVAPWRGPSVASGV
jgi:glycosyltransferase involved in cell wall biosynthesis